MRCVIYAEDPVHFGSGGFIAKSYNGPTDDIIYAWLGPVYKVERDENGNVLVYGKVTDGTVDSDEQIVDPSFAKKALAEWYDTGGNVRQMHSTNIPPAGKGILLESRPDGEYVRTKVVDPGAQKLCTEEVYTGYSVGISRPRIERDLKARGGRITGGKIVEVSLVDRPANPMAKFAVLKAAGSKGALEWVGKTVGVSADAVAEAFVAELTKAAGTTHTHAHPGPDGLPHSHEHTHAPNHGDHSDAHAHSHPETEDSVADDQQIGAAPATTLKATKCTKCKGSGMFGAAKCGKCGGSGMKGGGFPGDGVSDGTGEAKGAKAVPLPDHATGSGKQAPPAAAAPASAPQPGHGSPPAQGGSNSDGAPAGDASDAGTGAGDTDTADTGAGDDAAADTDDKPGAGPIEPEDDSDNGKAQKAARKAAGTVEQTDEGWQVYGKGGKVIGTHPTAAAAAEQYRAYHTERLAKKAAQKAASAARKSADRSAKSTADGLAHPVKVKREKKAPVTPWLIRRAHDFACPLYDTDAVLTVYPSVEKGEALGTPASVAIKGELDREVRKYDGKTKQARRIDALTKAIAIIGEIDGLDWAGDAWAGVRTDLHDAFKAANPMFGAEGGPDIPKPGDDSKVDPGQFKRPYITTGHQRASGEVGNTAPRIPDTTHPTDAGDYQRGPLTEGHQRYLTGKVAELHDHLVAWRPGLCKMDPSGSNAFDRQPPGAFSRDAAAAYSTHIDNRESASPKDKSVPDAQKVPGEKGDVPHFAFGPAGDPQAKTFTQEDLTSALTKALMPWKTKVEELEDMVTKLAAAPDPERSAHRGVTGLGKVAQASSVKAVTEGPRKAGRDKKAETIEYLQGLAHSASPGLRIPAIERLERMGVAPEPY